MSGRILALDIGNKYIGIAVSDPFNSYALPLTTYVRKNLKADVPYIFSVAKEKGATVIVCGLPLNFDGTASEQTARTQYFIDRLKENADGIEIVTADERCTTVEAERVLIEGKIRRENRKQYIDSIAATYILEGYLNKIKKQKGE